MSHATVPDLLSSYAEELSRLFEQLRAANAEAVKASAPQRGLVQKLWEVLTLVVTGAFQTFGRFPKVAGGWALLCFFAGALQGYLAWTAADEGPLPALFKMALFAAGFVLVPTALFGWLHLIPALRVAFSTKGRTTVASGVPEVFLALGVDKLTNRLTGYRVTPGYAQHHTFSHVEDVTTLDVPCAYLRLSTKRGDPVLLLNVSTGATYTWFGSAEFLKERCGEYSQALGAALSSRGLDQQLKELAALAASAKEKSALAAVPAVFVQKTAPIRTGAASSWDELILDDELKEELQTTVAMLKSAAALRRQGIEPPSSMLLYGPPGTGKTQVARTLATVSGLNFLPTTASDFKAEYIGASAPKVQTVFEKARSLSPCILFVDEIESVASRRDGGVQEKDRMSDEIVAELLVQLDGVAKHQGDVFFLAATNFPEKIDVAVLSRFKEKKEVPLPDYASRRRMLDGFLKAKPLAEGMEPALDAVAQRTEGYAGRDLLAVCERAEKRAVSRALKAGQVDQVLISPKDFLD
jgi:AAA+ superfamily predicted ATPase